MNGERFMGLHESIIDEVLFERVQKRLDLSAVDTYATLEVSPLLLLGSTQCGFCGANLTTYFSNNGKNDVKHYYYKCTTTSKQDKKKCPSRLVPARDLEEFTQSLMLHTARKQGFFDAITAQIVDNSEEEVSELIADKTSLFGNLSAIDKKINNLTENFTQGILDEMLKEKLVAKLAEMETEKARVQQRILEISNNIDEIQLNKFQKSSLKNILKEFDSIISGSSIEEKRQLIKTIIEGIKISAKTGEKDGIVEFKIRGNGTLVKKWNEVAKQRGVSLTPRLGWLRVKHGDSNPLSLEIPVVFADSAKGAQHIVIDPIRLPYYLNLSALEIDSLVQASLMRRAIIRVPKQKLDYRQLALSYQEKLDSGMFPTRASLARHLGVSRAWVTMVMKRGYVA
jgi:hypothetical protein